MSAANTQEDDNNQEPDPAAQLQEVLDNEPDTDNQEDIEAAFAEGLGEDPGTELLQNDPEPGNDDAPANMDGVTGTGAVDELGDMTEEELEEAEKTAASPEPETQEPTAAEKLAAAEAENQALHERVRKIEGQYGELNRNLKSIKDAGQQAQQDASAAGADAPTAAQVTKAMADTEAMKELREDFPVFANALDQQLAALQATLPTADALQGQVADQVAAGMQVLVEDMITDAHENWKEDVKTDRFQAWLLAQDDKTKAQYQSDSPRDAIKMLDKFAQYDGWIRAQPDDVSNLREDVLLERFALAGVESQPSASELRKQQRNARLQAATTPTRGGGGRSRPSAPSAEQVFSDAFEGKT